MPSNLPLWLKKYEKNSFHSHSSMLFSLFCFSFLILLGIAGSSQCIIGSAAFSGANTSVFVGLPLSSSSAVEEEYCECGPHGVPFTGGGGVQSVWVNGSSIMTSVPPVSEEEGLGIGILTRPLVLPFPVTTRSDCHCQCAAGYLLPSCRYRVDDPKATLGVWLVPHENSIEERPPLVSEDVLQALCTAILTCVTSCAGIEDFNASSSCEQQYLSLMNVEYALPSDVLHLSTLSMGSFLPLATTPVQLVVTLPGWMAQVVMVAIELDWIPEYKSVNGSHSRSCLRSSLRKSSLFLNSFNMKGDSTSMNLKPEESKIPSSESTSLVYDSSPHSLSFLPWKIVDVEELTMVRPPTLSFRGQWLRLYWSNNVSSEGGTPSWSIGAPNCVWILATALILLLLCWTEQQWLCCGTYKMVKGHK